MSSMQEVDQARVALQDGEDLERAVGGADRWAPARRGRRLLAARRLSAARG